jgi:hydroxypyruvate isomerase
LIVNKEINSLKLSICNGAYPGKDVEFHLRKVVEHGFHGLEYYRWWNLDLEYTSMLVEKIGVPVNSICTKYIAMTDLKQRELYIQGLKETIAAAKKLGCSSIVSQVGNSLHNLSIQEQEDIIVETLKQCTPLLEDTELQLEIEPLNSLYDHQGYFLQTSAQANRIVEQVKSPKVKICFDFYHQQISEGNVLNNFDKYYQNISHVHFADNPNRTELGIGEMNYYNILQFIVNSGFKGYIGLECKFTKDTDECLNSFMQHYIKPIVPSLIKERSHEI